MVQSSQVQLMGALQCLQLLQPLLGFDSTSSSGMRLVMSSISDNNCTSNSLLSLHARHEPAQFNLSLLAPSSPTYHLSCFLSRTHHVLLAAISRCSLYASQSSSNITPFLFDNVRFLLPHITNSCYCLAIAGHRWPSPAGWLTYTYYMIHALIQHNTHCYT